MSVSRYVALLAAISMGLGCTPEVRKGGDVDTSAAVVALFAPDSADPCNSVIPFPSDLAKDPVTGRLNVPICPEDDDQTIGLKLGLKTLNGFSLQSKIYTKFSAPITTDALAATVMLVDVTPPNAGGLVAIDRYFDTSDNTLYLVPSEPLKPDTTYVGVVLRKAIMGAGELKGQNGETVVSDQLFTFAKSREPLTDSSGHSRYAALDDASANALEALRKGSAPLFEQFDPMMEPAGLTRDDVLVAWPFTTQSVTSHLAAVAAGAQALGGATLVHERDIAASEHLLIKDKPELIDNLCDVHTGHAVLQSFLGPQGMFAVDESGNLMSQQIGVDYLLTTPNTDGCNATWDMSKVVIFAHTLSRCKNDVLAIANTLAAAGWASLAVDGPRAGSRTVDTLGDQDIDGCPDQGALPELLALAGADPNPFGVRDRLREWAIELVQLADALKATPWSAAGLDAPATAPSTEIALLGHSWGGMAAVLAGSVGGSIDKVIANSASASFGTLFTPIIEETIAAEIAAAGLDPTVEPGASLLAAAVEEGAMGYQWAMDAADPLYAASAYPSDLSVLIQVVSAGGLATMPDYTLHEASTQTLLADTFHPSETSKTTFSLVWDNAGTMEPICASAADATAALLAPCAGTDDSPDLRALAALQAMRTQIITFLAAGAICTPDITTGACS